MKVKKILAFVLAAVMLFSMLPVAAANSFTRTETWSDTLFTDVAKADWFYENVKEAYELGLMVGYGDGTFNPTGNITMAQTIAVAARVHAIATKGEETFEQGAPWYQVYVDYAKATGILTADVADYDKAATRLEFARILAKAMPEKDLKAINDVKYGDIPDVADDEAVYKLYRAGVLMGNDEKGTFAPESTIQRSEMAAIVTRMALPELRIEKETEKQPTSGNSGNIVIRPEQPAPEQPAPEEGVEVTAPVESENGAVKTEVSLESDTVKATVPAGVALEDGVDELTLTVSSMEETTSSVTAGGNETLTSYDVHIEGVAADNTVPMTVTLPGLLKKGLNTTSVALYHVENGVTVPMTMVADPANHNEFSYDPATGDVVICTATFSEYVAVTDNKNLWKGEFDYTWYDGNSSPYTISSADQLAAFGKIVDGTREGYEADTFVGKTVNLGQNINLGGTISFNPIGCGYAAETGVTNSDGVTGRPFKGTFNGQGHTISGLYQNGWDLGLSYCTLGGGLFASIADGTVQNLTISGANIVMECVEMGVLVGLSQGNCTYDNIKIYNSKIANYQRATGGLIGEVSALNGGGKTTITDVIIGSNVVVGSLWGDFDAPVGGVIGARWDDENVTTVEMKKVYVSCKLDVYNDVTSTYQWYAYRRAGMLIGNTDTPPADGKNSKIAKADFLTCLPDENGNDSVVVIYDDWANYHYCEFSNYNSNWPWVRVEAGENCSAYSNPRYGVPNDPTTNLPVQDSLHNHSGDDEHLVLLPFHQLYGGGQGVYGAETHPGVVEGKYTVTFMDHGEVLDVLYVSDNDEEYNLEGEFPSVVNGDKKLLGWVNANNEVTTKIPANNTADVILYPKWENEYVVRCIDTKGNVAYYNFITDAMEDAEYETIAEEVNNTLTAIQNEVDATGNVIVVKWSGLGSDLIISVAASDLKNAGADVILTATPELKEGSITLEPVYDEAGELIAYKVTNVVANNSNSNVVIPPYVGTIPVTSVSNEAAAGFDNLHSITIPNTVTSIGANAIAESWGGIGDSGETITIYYEGSYADWTEKVALTDGWDDGLSNGSRIFFLNGTGKVDTTQGYLQAQVSGYGSAKSVTWSKSTVTSDLVKEYTGYCDCAVATTGDTAHTYVDAEENVMGRNDEGTPVNAEDTEIYFEDGGWFGDDKLTDGTNTYYRYRPDKAYWEGVEIPTT